MRSPRVLFSTSFLLAFKLQVRIRCHETVVCSLIPGFLFCVSSPTSVKRNCCPLFPVAPHRALSMACKRGFCFSAASQFIDAARHGRDRPFRTLVIQIATLQSGRRQHVQMGLFSIMISRRISTTHLTGSLCWGLTADRTTVMICSHVTVGKRTSLTGSGSRGVRRGGNWMRTANSRAPGSQGGTKGYSSYAANPEPQGSYPISSKYLRIGLLFVSQDVYEGSV
ncbi:hypothetical protein BJV77DRAFT_164203 [Russula vinacea]|nr:hypothetical protein BJV77DRAFT_164203 [Russula vinacea]